MQLLSSTDIERFTACHNQMLQPININNLQFNLDRNSGNYGKEQYDDIRESRMVLESNDRHNSVSQIRRMTAVSCPRLSDNYHHLTTTRGIPISVKLNLVNDKTQHSNNKSCMELSEADVNNHYFPMTKSEDKNTYV